MSIYLYIYLYNIYVGTPVRINEHEEEYQSFLATTL